MLYLKNQVVEMKQEELMHMELGIEGFSSFNEFLGSVIGHIGKLADKFLNNEYPAIDVMPIHVAKIEKLLKHKDLDLLDLEDLLIYRTEGMTRPNLDFVSLLLEQGEEMYTLIDRIYNPMNAWFAKALTQESFSEKLWNDRELEMVDIAKFKSKLADCFKTKRISDEDPDMTPLGKLYASDKQYRNTFEKLNKIAELGKEFDIGELEKAEKKLAAFIKQSMNTEGIELQRATKEKIAIVLRALIAETEYFVAFNYLLVTTITAWNDSDHKIKIALEEK